VTFKLKKKPLSVLKIHIFFTIEEQNPRRFLSRRNNGYILKKGEQKSQSNG
jgi:hypothetical protein